ncbi:MAG TPA: ABC transporter substrate-binding protein [Candidatus Dormibacteraeota bacterium]|nr:ABC transporter substrate-binding protein [Candidatus Dormibacteraeota bacterium]
MRATLHRVANMLVLAAMICSSFAIARGATPLRAGSDISYAPLEFYTAGSHAMTGFDIDLVRAIGSKLGVPVTIANHRFDDLLPSVTDGRFDVAISALSDTRKREKLVDFVDYLLAGSGMLVPRGNPRHVFNLGALCGLRVDVQKGTSQEIALESQSRACASVHLHPLDIRAFATDDQAFAYFAAGKSDVHVTDYPVVAYLARTQGGGTKYQVAGKQFDVVPYAIAVAKKNPAERASVTSALLALINDGTYDALLKKWGLSQGALRSAPLNAGTLFER